MEEEPRATLDLKKQGHDHFLSPNDQIVERENAVFCIIANCGVSYLYWW